MPASSLRPALGAALLLVGAALGQMIAGGPRAASAQNAEAPPLRHVVLFRFKAEATPEQVREIVEAFGQLPKKIDGVTAFEWGTDVSPEGRSEGFTHCFVVTFKDAAARDKYLPHPAHQEFVALLLPRLDKVLVVDYFARK